MNKKKITRAIIGILITLALTISIVNIIAYSPGENVTIGMGTKYEHKEGEIDLGRNLNYFCGKMGTKLAGYNQKNGAPYKTIAEVRILGQKVNINFAKEISNPAKGSETLEFEETETRASKALALLYYKIQNQVKGIRSRITDRTNDPSDGKVVYFNLDYGQVVMWKAIYDWNHQLFIR